MKGAGPTPTGRRLRLESFGRFPLRGMKLSLPTGLLSSKRQCWDQLPMKHSVVKGGGVSICQGEMEPTEDKATFLNEPKHRIFTNNHLP